MVVTGYLVHLQGHDVNVLDMKDIQSDVGNFKPVLVHFTTQ